jgi:moderate conductance mechanosensitive channel
MPTPLGISLLDGKPEGTEIALALGVAIVIGWLVAAGAARLVKLLLKSIYGRGNELPPLAAQPVRLTRLVTFVLTFAVTAVPLLDAIGKRLDVGLDSRSMLQWAVGSGVRIAVIATFAWLLVRIVSTSIERLELEVARSSRTDIAEHLRRAQTLGGLVRNISAALIVTVATLMILRELNVDILPMLTGAGIAGVALGFGAQWLVRDLIAGFFLILEDQVRVGDSVVINGQGGTVEAINLRTIVLRDVEGAVHIVPNGAITTLANRSRDFAYYLIDLNLDFRQDTDRVVQILRDTAATLQSDELYKDAILEPLEVLGVESFKDGQVVIRSRLKTVPQRQFEVGRELRRRVRYALDEAGIELPAAGIHGIISSRTKTK